MAPAAETEKANCGILYVKAQGYIVSEARLKIRGLQLRYLKLIKVI